MTQEEKLVRVSVRLSGDLHSRMAEVVPWGLRRHVLEAVLKLVIDAIQQDGQVVAGAILDGNFKLVPINRDNNPDQNLVESR